MCDFYLAEGAALFVSFTYLIWSTKATQFLKLEKTEDKSVSGYFHEISMFYFVVYMDKSEINSYFMQCYATVLDTSSVLFPFENMQMLNGKIKA